MSLRRRKIAVVPLVIISWALTTTAHAHMAAEGVNAFGNGALHPWTTPSHVLVLLSLALLLGQQEPFDLKAPLIIFPPLSAVALAWTVFATNITIPQPVLIGLALVLGALVGLAAKFPRGFTALLCAVVAVAISFDSGVGSDSGFVVAKILFGTWFSLNASVLYIAICASHAAEKQWSKVGIRIIGSWILAISLMVLAFSLKKSSDRSFQHLSGFQVHIISTLLVQMKQMDK